MASAALTRSSHAFAPWPPSTRDRLRPPGSFVHIRGCSVGRREPQTGAAGRVLVAHLHRAVVRTSREDGPPRVRGHVHSSAMLEPCPWWRTFWRDVRCSRSWCPSRNGLTCETFFARPTLARCRTCLQRAGARHFWRERGVGTRRGLTIDFLVNNIDPMVNTGRHHKAGPATRPAQISQDWYGSWSGSTSPPQSSPWYCSGCCRRLDPKKRRPAPGFMRSSWRFSPCCSRCGCGPSAGEIAAPASPS